MRPQPKRIQFAGSPKCKPPKLEKSTEAENDDQTPKSTGPVSSTGGAEPSVKSGSVPIENVACPGCKALTIKLRTMEKRLSTLEMVKIKASTLNGQEYQLRANTSDYIVTIKEAILKILNVKNVHLFYKDLWLDPELTLGAYYTGREADINVVIVDENASPPSRPSQIIDPHLTWQPFNSLMLSGREFHQYWSDTETPIILDVDPQTLPQTPATDPWFHGLPPDAQEFKQF
jgi:hypothetical protein